MSSHLFKSSLPLSGLSLRSRVSSWSASHSGKGGASPGCFPIGRGSPQAWGGTLPTVSEAVSGPVQQVEATLARFHL